MFCFFADLVNEPSTDETGKFCQSSFKMACLFNITIFVPAPELILCFLALNKGIMRMLFRDCEIKGKRDLLVLKKRGNKVD
jgi:hypothetical protein